MYQRIAVNRSPANWKLIGKVIELIRLLAKSLKVIPEAQTLCLSGRSNRDGRIVSLGAGLVLSLTTMPPWHTSETTQPHPFKGLSRAPSLSALCQGLQGFPYDVGLMQHGRQGGFSRKGRRSRPRLSPSKQGDELQGETTPV